MEIIYRKFILAFILSIIGLLAIPVFAQTSQVQSPEERAQKWDAWMKKEIPIVAEQEVIVHNINLNYATLNGKLISSAQSRLAKYRSLNANSKDKDAELKKIMTKDQFAIYKDKKTAFQKQMAEDFRKR